MRIGIIGTGSASTALAELWAGGGHNVMLGSRDPRRGVDVAAALGRDIRGGSIAEAARFGEVVVLATSWGEAREALEAAGSLENRVLLDMTGLLEPGGLRWTVSGIESSDELAWQRSNRAYSARALGGQFQQILDAAPPAIRPTPTIFCCGDYAALEEAVLGLLRTARLDDVDASLAQALRPLEQLAALLQRLGEVRRLGPTAYVALVTG